MQPLSVCNPTSPTSHRKRKDATRCALSFFSPPSFSFAHPVSVRVIIAPRRPLAALLPCAPLVSRCGRARCPHRAAARGGSPPRCAAWHPEPSPLRGPLALRPPRAPLPCPIAVGHDVWPPGLPARAAARGDPPPRCAAWQVAHAESFAYRGSVRGTVRGRAAHPARCLAAARSTLPTLAASALQRPWGLPTRPDGTQPCRWSCESGTKMV